MKDPVNRLKQTIAVAIVFLIVYTGIMLSISQRHYEELIILDSVNKTEAVRGMVEGYSKTVEEIGKGFFEDENTKVRLMAIRLSDQFAGGEFIGDRFSGDSMAVRMRGGQLELPPEAEGLFANLSPDMVAGEYTQTRTTWNGGSGSATAEEVFLTSGHIAGEWYCVRWTPVSEYDAYVRTRLSEEKLIDALDSAEDADFLVIDKNSGNDEDEWTLAYKTGALSKYSSLSDLGITGKELESERFWTATDDGKEYLCSPIETENLSYMLVCCNYVEDEKAAFIGDIIMQILFAAVLLAGLITWCYSVQWLVRRERLSEAQRENYNPKAVKKRTTRLTLMSLAIAVAFAFTTVMLQYMYQENQIGSNALGMLQAQIEDERKNALSLHELEAERYVQLGEMIRGMLAEDPALLERERLAEISDTIHADYLILFDSSAEEIACSREYTGFTLPADSSDPLYDFRRLLKGIPYIVHDPEKDMITGDTRQFVGIRVDDPGGKGAFGALLIALPSRTDRLVEEEEENLRIVRQQVYRRLQSKERMVMEIDPVTNKILSCSRSDLEGSDINSLGMDPKGLRDMYMGFYFIDDNWYFGISSTTEDTICMYLADSTGMSRIGLIFSLIAGGLFLAGYMLTAKFALKEYTDENFERYSREMEEQSEKYMDKIKQRAPALSPIATDWKNMLPEQKTKTILQILAGIVLVGMLIASLLNSPLTRHSPLHFVIRGNWTRGINFFSVIAVIVTFCVEYLAYLTVKVVFIMLYSLTDSAGETMLRLVRSFLNYAMFIGAVCVSLSFLGVDTQTLLASIGLLSLAISLGAKDIVADILAGLSIVFERAFSVGDIIQIGDFKGKVLEIGVRSTKVINGTKDIKIFNNHEIGSVINYSKRNTICVVRITLPVDLSVDSLEALFEKELPKVREVNPHIVSGPKFNGILELQNDQMVVGISAEGPEEHIHSIRKDLNRVLQSMAERELLEYAQSNITINVNGAGAGIPEDSSVPDQKEKRAEKGDHEDDHTPENRGRRFARLIRGYKRNDTENTKIRNAVKNMNKEK